jgi:hypothetical protein
MKKSVISGIIGLAAIAATSSYGQGYILLSNYSSQANQLTYGAGVPANGVSGALGSGPLSTAWTVGLYFVAGSQSLVDPAGTGTPIAPLALGTGTGSSIAIGAGNANGNPGYYASIPFFNAGVAAGSTITVEMIAYPTAAGSYAAAAYRGHSSPFTIVTVPVTSTSPNITGSATGVGSTGDITVLPAAVPEPTTLALAGLGGLASLVALRRKQS